MTILVGLEGLTRVRGPFLFMLNGVTSLAGLEGLAAVDGFFRVALNEQLGSLNGLDNLQSVGGDLAIDSNHKLSSLSGLDNLETVVGARLVIESNSMLKKCEATAFAQRMGKVCTCDFGNLAGSCP